MKIGKLLPSLAIAIGLALASVPGALAANVSTGMLDDEEDYKDAQRLIKAEDYAKAIPHLEKVLKDYADEADALNLMGFSLRKVGRTQEALVFYAKALKQNPKHLGANEYLGELYVELKDLGKARERLGVLKAACGTCEQYQDLERAIARASGS